MPDAIVPPKEQTFGELFDKAAKKNFITSAMDSTEELMTYGKPVEGYKPSYEDVDKISKDMTLSEEQRSALSGSLSPEELQFRAQKFQERNTDKKSIDDAGWKGVAAEALSYMADPVMIPTYAIKTPLVVGKVLAGVTAKFASKAVVGVLDRAAGAAAIGGVTGLGQEALLSVYDTERDVNDVVLAGISGMVGGAAFSTMADGGASLYNKITAKKQLGKAMDEVADGYDWDNNLVMINDADNVITGAAMGRVDSQAYSKHFDFMEADIPDPMARKRVLTEGDAINSLIGELQPIAAQRLPRGQRMELDATIKKAEHDIGIATAKLQELLDAPPIGAGKALAAARKARANEVNHLEKSISDNTKLSQDTSTGLEPHTTGTYATATSDIGRLQQGIIPDNLRAKYLDLITPEDAAPSFEEALSHLPKKEEKLITPEVAKESAEIKTDEAIELSKPDTSIGAAEVKGAILFPDTEGAEISDTYKATLGYLRKLGSAIPVTNSYGSTALSSRVLARTKDNTLRGLASLVFNDPHGVRGAPQSAVAFADAMRTRIMPKVVFVEDMAANEYARAKGISPLQAGKYNQAVVEFDREVMLAVSQMGKNLPTPSPNDTPVLKAAKARAEAYAESLKLMKRYGVRGFDDVEERANYTPVMFGSNDITAALDKHGKDAVLETLTRGYMTGKVPLSSKSAMIVAENTLERYFRKTGATAELKPQASISGKIADIVTELRNNKVPDSEIKTVVNMLQDKALDDTVSSRAMQSLHPNLSASSLDGLRFVDLIDSSTASVDKYVRDASAQAAFAKHGLRSRRQVEDTIDEAFRRHREEITELVNEHEGAKKFLTKEGRESYPAELIAQKEKLVKDFERLGDIDDYRKFLNKFEGDYKNGVKAAFGETIEDANSVNAAASVLGKLVNLQMLGFSGLAQVADTGVVIARSGLGAVLRNLPTTLHHGVRSILPSAKYFMQNKEMSNMAEVFGTIGHQDYLFGHKMMNGAEYGDAVIGHVSSADKVLDRANWLQSTMSFLRPMQGMIDELSARSLMTNIVRLSKDGMFTGKVRKEFLDVGKISEESLDTSLLHIKHAMGKGDDIFAAIRTLDPKIRDELGTAMRTVHTSNISRSYYGELPAFTNTSMGKVLMKLQSFALVAYEKAIQRGIRGDKAGLVAATVWSAGIASIFIDVDVSVQSLKQPEDKRDDFIRKRTEDERAYTIAGRMSQVAVFSTLAQVYNLANPDQDSALKPFGEYRGVAASGALGKVAGAAQAGAKLVTGESLDPESDKYKLYGAMPLLNTAVGMAVLNTL